ncbi:MAG: C2 domain-containing protein [Nannocystaceae bacterium]|nr:C2 domain-containing protein [bacterium]
MKRCVLVGLGVVLGFGSGCFEDPDQGGSGATASGTDGSAGTSGSSVDPDDTGDSQDAAGDPTTDPTVGGCMGCLDAAGGCLAGDLDQACGALAQACVACEEGSFCNEGSCEPLPACTPDNCEGCCDGDDCLDGTDIAACGRSGQQCAVCSSESTCNEGVCELPCATTCDGCCDASGDCIPLEQIDDSACGIEGDTCASCPADFACSAGSCISTACQSTCDGCCDGATCNTGDTLRACGQGGSACEPCPAGTLCTDTCEADPDATWQLLIESAVTTTVDGNGNTWDGLGGLPDPYVRVTLDGDTQTTPIADDTIEPEWNATLFEDSSTARMLMPITFELRDSDVITDETMGECTYELTPDLFGSTVQAQCVDEEENELWTLYFSLVAI